MMVPEFMRFYGYSAEQTLGENAVTFFSLCNSMYRLMARESLNRYAVMRGAFADDSGSIVSELQKQEKGIHGILKEIKNIPRRGK